VVKAPAVEGPAVEAPARVSLLSIAVAFGRVSASAFGGGQMPAIRREVVRRSKWMNDDQYLEVLAIGQLMPGSNPTSVAVLVGSHVRGVAGATVALVSIVLPGFIILLVIGAFALDSHASWVQGALRACAAFAVGLTFANAIELTIKRLKIVDIAIMAGVAAAVLLLHFSLALTLVIFTPLALVLTRPKKKSEPA
jgi:chromate transporter